MLDGLSPFKYLNILKVYIFIIIMELSCIHNNIKFDITSTAYTQLVKDDRALCVICHVEEPPDVCWDRYVLRCGHKYHTRCFRTWCGSKGKVNCPQCGDVQQIPQNRYCSGCDVWGHCGCIDILEYLL